jgi:hypothetical protein
MMYRNVTAIYRTHEVADMVRRGLADLGVSSSRIHVVPDRDEPVGGEGYRDDNRYIDELSALHLPDDDLRTYQQSVRRGDYVVSVEVDADDVPRVQEVMRRPEAESYNLDTRDQEFRDETLIAPTPMGTAAEPGWLGRRDTTTTDPYTRAYERDQPLREREPR